MKKNNSPVERDKAEYLKELIMVYFAIKEYKNAIKYIEKYNDLKPGDTEFLFVASYCYRKLKRLQKAVNIGERVRLRSPYLVKNLNNLAEIYIMLHKLERAEMILNESLTHEPENQAAVKIQKIIQETGASKRTRIIPQ